MADLVKFFATEAVGDINVPGYTSPYLELFRELLYRLAMSGAV